MIKKNKKGFTLVELLAVIAVLSILITLAVPVILKIFNSSKEKAFIVHAQELYKSVEKEIMHKQMNNPGINITRFYSKDDSSNLKLDGIDYCVKISNNKITSIAVTNSNYWYYNDNISSVSDISVNDTDKFGTGHMGIACNLSGDATLINGGLETLFTYTVSNNLVAIAGYNIGTATFTVSNLTACQNNIGSILAINGYDNATAAEICSEPYIDNTNVGMNMEKYLLFDIIKSSDYSTCGLSDVEINKNPTDIVIPSTINGKSVVAIKPNAFKRDNLSSVIIPNSITSISNSAFAYNNLTSIVIPNSVTSIGNLAFSNNRLVSVALSNGITSINNSVFRNNNLNSITIPNSVTSINNYAFRNNNLTSVTIPSSVMSIGGYVFANNSLTSVTIKGKSNSTDFTDGYGTGIWGWKSGSGCSEATCITWEGSSQ